MPKKPKRMFMVFSPRRDRMWESLRMTAKKCKADWCGGSEKDWGKWKEAGWKVYPMLVTAKWELWEKIDQRNADERSVANQAK